MTLWKREVHAPNEAFERQPIDPPLGRLVPQLRAHFAIETTDTLGKRSGNHGGNRAPPGRKLEDAGVRTLMWRHPARPDTKEEAGMPRAATPIGQQSSRVHPCVQEPAFRRCNKHGQRKRTGASTGHRRADGLRDHQWEPGHEPHRDHRR